MGQQLVERLNANLNRGDSRRGGERRTEAAARIADRAERDRQRHQASLERAREQAAQQRVIWLAEPVLLCGTFGPKVLGVSADARDDLKREYGAI